MTPTTFSITIRGQVKLDDTERRLAEDLPDPDSNRQLFELIARALLLHDTEIEVEIHRLDIS